MIAEIKQRGRSTLGRAHPIRKTSCRFESLECRRLFSWGSVDDFQLAPGQPARILQLATDTAGNVYAVGDAHAADGSVHGIVRQKLSNSATWSTLLDQPGASFTGVTSNASGDLNVSGNL